MTDVDRIVVFRCYKEPGICENRLQLLRRFNPDVRIFIYFRNTEKRQEFRNLDPYFEDVYVAGEEEAKKMTDKWLWKNGDLALKSWYQCTGHTIDFDVLHVIDWDLLLFGSLDRIYQNVPKDGIGLTALTKLRTVEGIWYWTSNPPERSEWIRLLNSVKADFGYCQEPFACLGPGYCLPKAFLEKYAAVDVPDECLEEIRLPLYGQILGFDLFNTGFFRSWFDKDEQIKYFNCLNSEIKLRTIRRELSDPSGRRAFHPFRSLFKLKMLKRFENL